MATGDRATARRSDASRQPYSMPAAGIRGAHPDKPDDDYSAQVSSFSAWWMRPASRCSVPLSPKANGKGDPRISCPGHDDNHPSLAINIRSGGVKCFAGCFGYSAQTAEAHCGPEIESALKLSPSSHVAGTSSPTSDDSEAVRAVSETTLAAVRSIDELASRRGFPPGALRANWRTPCRAVTRSEWTTQKRVVRSLRIRRERPCSVRKLLLAQETRMRHGSATPFTTSRLVKTRCEEVFICEGASDVWAMDAAGVPAISFLAGAATMPSERAIAKLIDHEVRHAVLLYDWDDAGQRGAQLLKQRLEASGIASDMPPARAAGASGHRHQ